MLSINNPAGLPSCGGKGANSKVNGGKGGKGRRRRTGDGGTLTENGPAEWNAHVKRRAN